MTLLPGRKLLNGHNLCFVMATHSSILAGKSHRQRSLAGCSFWGHKESDRTEQLST